MKVTNNTESNMERIEREEAQRATRAELAPRLTALVGRLIQFYADGWRCGYLVKVGETYSSIQPLAVGGELPDPVRVDILDIKPSAVIQTKWQTLCEYIAANGVTAVKEPPKQLDPVVKKERVAKVKVLAQAAVKGAEKVERGNATEEWLAALRAIGEDNIRRVMPGFKALATSREALGAAHLVKAGKELFAGLWITSNFSSDAKQKLLAKIQEAAK